MHAIEIASLHEAIGLSLEDVHQIQGSTARSVEKLIIVPAPKRDVVLRRVLRPSEHVQHVRGWPVITSHMRCQSLRLAILAAHTTPSR